jgi:hypothetical protein
LAFAFGWVWMDYGCVGWYLSLSFVVVGAVAAATEIKILVAMLRNRMNASERNNLPGLSIVYQVNIILGLE